LPLWPRTQCTHKKYPFTPPLGLHRVNLTIHGCARQKNVEESSRNSRTSTSSRTFSQKSSLGGPSAQSATFTPAISTCSPLDDSSKALARQFIVKKKALQPLHTHGDRCLHLCPQPIRPAAPSDLDTLSLIAYW
jgi:hypothetical protein